MCLVSFIGDQARDRWEPILPQVQQWFVDSPPTRAEFDALKAEVEFVKTLLLAAKQYDKDNGEPDCEMEEKVDVLRRIAKIVGVDLEEVFRGVG